MKRGLFRTFWHREVSGKVFLRALYSQFSHFSIQYIANMSFSQFCMYFRFKYTPLVKSVYIHKIRNIQNPLASRSFGESLSQSTLQPIFTFFHTIHCKHVIFTILYVFPFQIYPLVNTTMVYEKGSIYVFLASRSFGESLSQSTLQPIFTFFHTIHCKHVIFTILYVFPFQIYPLVNTTMVYKIRNYLEPFGIEKFRGKSFLEHFIANFHIFPYNTLQTCHFHNFVCISVSNIPPS